MAYPAGSSRSAFLAISAGSVAALAYWKIRVGFSSEGFFAHQFVLGLVSLCLWSSAYLLLHRHLTFVSAAYRPLFAPVLSLIWGVVSTPFVFGVFILGPQFGEQVLSWAESAHCFTWGAALVHGVLLVAERTSEASRSAKGVSPVLPAASPSGPAPEVGLLAGLLLAFPAMLFGLVSLVLLQDSLWFMVGPGGGPLAKIIFNVMPAAFGAVPYLSAYLLFWKVRPQIRPLWAPLWGLGWFLLAPLCFFLGYGAFVGVLYLVLTYVFTCLTALTHSVLMYGWTQFLRRRD
ncbi:MAG: hypothetical protein RLZZ233_533 [Verrucomicrobiota bacterium]|jgi:hypothetical protein